MSASLRVVPPRIRQLAAELAEPKPMRRGSLSERTIKCSKPNCACAQDPKTRHGPYYSLTQAVGGKTRSRFLTPEQAALAEQQIATGRGFRQQVDTFWEACERWADVELECTPSPASEKAEKGGSKRSFKSASPKKSKRS